MSLYIVASGAVAPLTAQQKEEKNGARHRRKPAPIKHLQRVLRRDAKHPVDATCPEDTADITFMRHRPEGWSHGLGYLRERKSRVSAREEKSGSGLVLIDGRILTRSTRHTNNRYIVAIPFGYRNGSGGRCRWTFDSSIAWAPQASLRTLQLWLW